MRAIVYDAYGNVPTLREVPAPACPDDGAVIAVRATGVCRSDWHAWKGHDPVALPNIPGHEFAGVVHQVGEKVQNFAVGERVTAPFVFGCGDCPYCRAGEAQVCPNQTQPGFTDPGSFAEFVVVRAADFNLVRVPDGVDDLAAASLGCRFATAFRALTVHGRVQEGQWVAVHGCGGVGLSAIMIATALGARVIAVDIQPEALARARKLGAVHTIQALRQAQGTEVADEIQAITGGGAHVSLDALGSPATAAASVHSLRRRGRHIQVGLLLGSASTPDLPMDKVVAYELEIYGSHGMAAQDYPAMLELVAAGRLKPAELVGRVVDLDRAGIELAGLDRASGAGMTVVKIGD